MEGRDDQDQSDEGRLGMDVPLIVARSLALVTASIHAAGGESVMRKLSPEMLPSDGSGGWQMTKLELHVAWHHLAPAVLTATAALAWWGVL
jgi:hypothetical protein